MKTYHTAEIASIIGIHPNTVRFYEEQHLLSPIPRMANGYRIFSECHLHQLKFIRLAFHAEILSNNLRNEAVDIVKTAAKKEFDAAIQKTLVYQTHLESEVKKAKEAVLLTEQLLSNHISTYENSTFAGRREAAEQIGVSMDVLRDWERNGLVHIPRKGNRRQYSVHEMNILKIIAILRNAHYSQMAIRRMLQKLDQGETNLISAIDRPDQTEEIISVADRYITSLYIALDDTEKMLKLLEIMKQ